MDGATLMVSLHEASDGVSVALMCRPFKPQVLRSYSQVVGFQPGLWSEVQFTGI